MKASFLVRQFDRAVLALVATRRRRRRAAEMAELEAVLEDLEQGPPREAQRSPTVPAPVRPTPNEDAGSSRELYRRWVTGTVGVSVLFGATFFALVLFTSPPSSNGVVDPANIAASGMQSAGAVDRGIPEGMREEILLAERQTGRYWEAEAAADLVRVEDVERGQGLLRALGEACEGDATDTGWGTADCGLAQERAINAAREFEP